MAEALKRQYELLSLRVGLRVGLRPDQAGTRVFCVLERGGDSLKRIDEWSFTPKAFGLPQRLDRRTSLSEMALPGELVERVNANVADLHTPDGVLWLHLEQPAGYLGLLPWERLASRTGLAVLRLPDVLAPPPREAAEGLGLALCASSPVASEQFDLVTAVTNYLGDAAVQLGRKVRVHVFADMQHFQALERAIGSISTPHLDVSVHDPMAAASYETPERVGAPPAVVRGVANPWLLWIRDAMRGRSLDVVHFIGHGYVAQDRGAIALAESPARNEDKTWARFVGYAELNVFLNQIGAWSLALTSPRDGRNEAGLRLLADEVGQRRPGSVLHHSAPLDPYWRGLMEAYAFLYAAQPVEAPVHPGLVMYCQPSLVHRDEVTVLDAMGASEREQLNADFPGDTVPSWLAATHRYLEQASFQVGAAKGRREDDESPAPRRRSIERFGGDDALEATIGKLSGIAAKYGKWEGS